MTGEPEVAARFRELLGADAVLTGNAVGPFAIDGCAPQGVLFPATVEELSRCTAAADSAGLAVIPVGNGTQLGIGRVPHRYDVALSTRRMCRVLAHEAADMTVTVEAGLTLAALNAALAPAHQRLPLDPPHPEGITIGGLIATDACGPLRWSQGKVRDLLIGIKAVLADGTIVNGGGRVVKNVAGYDLMKLFTGSFGTLAIVVEATFKVRPCPEHEAVVVIPAASTDDATAFALGLLDSPLAPLFIEVLNGSAAASLDLGVEACAVVVGCGGTVHEIEAQRAQVEAQASREAVRVLMSAEAEKLSAALRDFPAAGLLHRLPPPGHAIGRSSDVGAQHAAPLRPDEDTSRPESASTVSSPEGPCGCKLGLLPSKLGDALRCIEDETTRRGLEVALVAHAGNGIGVLRFRETPATHGAFPSFAEWLRPTVGERGGWVVFDALPGALKARIDPWGPEPPGMALMEGIKKTLDPNGRLSPGRFVGGI
jgi:glycolate oxidase FAD binding subunit